MPQSWFDTYRPGDDGFTLDKGLVAFVLGNGTTQVLAHELGHTYGFPESYTQDSKGNVTYPGPSASPTAYWVQNMQSVDPSAIDLMGDANVVWITDNEYGKLFQNFLAPTPDPEVLLVTGTISPTGSVAFWKIYMNANGRVTPNVSGNGLVQILGQNGAVLASVTFDTKAQPTHTPPGQPVGEVPFAVALPFAGAFQVQVQISGKLTAQVNVATKLLVDAVNSIPDSGFVNNPSQLRNALLNKIGALDSQLSAGAIQGAVSKLQNDIEKSLQDWLVDGYTVQTPLQYTKDQVIALVNELIQQLGS